MKTTTTKTNTALIQFSDGQRQKFETTKTIPEIREDFKIGSSFFLKSGAQTVRVEALTIL